MNGRSLGDRLKAQSPNRVFKQLALWANHSKMCLIGKQMGRGFGSIRNFRCLPQEFLKEIYSTWVHDWYYAEI
ncbi:hypothetical protein Ddc_01912 [Ditylenchus destructor]|nr:hypothetical protein Ddc_01912 [Ditylenchus destructor]